MPFLERKFQKVILIRISETKLDNLLQRLKIIIDTDDVEIKDCALLALMEELQELKGKDD